MFRKIALTALAAALVSTAVTAIPADAATKISNGVACSKSGATTKVSGYSYRCARNTMVKNSKLTWLSVECLTAIKQYNAAVKARAGLASIETQTAELDRQLTAAKDTLANITTSLDTAKAQIIKSRASLAATTDNALKTTLAESVSNLATAILRLTTSRGKLIAQISNLESRKTLLTAAPEQINENVVDSKASANLLCAKGF